MNTFTKKTGAYAIFILFLVLTLTSINATSFQTNKITSNNVEIKNNFQTSKNIIKNEKSQTIENLNTYKNSIITKIKSRLIKNIYEILVKRTNLLNKFDTSSLSLKIYTKWQDENQNIYNKTTPITNSPFFIDINNDEINDVKISYSPSLDLVEVGDSDFNLLLYPYALGLITDIHIIKTENGCIKNDDFFEISAQVNFPEILGSSKQKSLNVGGYRSIEGKQVPNDFKISYKYIPYAIRNLFGYKLNPVFIASQDPGNTNESEISYFVGITEINSDEPLISCELENKPAKPFHLKFKMGLKKDEWKFKFNSIDGIFENVNLSLIKRQDDKKIGGSFNFKDLKDIFFKSEIKLKTETASVSFSSEKELDFNFNFFNEVKQSNLQTGVLISKGKSIAVEMIKDSEITLKINNKLDLYDLTFQKPNYNLYAGLISGKNSGSISLNLSESGLKIGSSVGLTVGDISFDSYKTGISLGSIGNFEVEAGGWIHLYKAGEINNIELKLYSLSFEFLNVDFLFNDERFSIDGLFDFGERQERIFHIQWRKPDLFKFYFDKDVELTVRNFGFSTPSSWLIEKVEIKSISWSNGRNFLFDVTTNSLKIDIDTSISLNDFSLLFYSGIKLDSNDIYFEGLFDFGWSEESLLFDVGGVIDWDLTLDTVNFDKWNIEGFLQGNVGINSQWITDESGTLELNAGSDGILHDFIIERKGTQIHLGTMELSQGSLVFNWKKGDNGYLTLSNYGLEATLSICELIHPSSDFKFEIGSINLIPGDTSFEWVNNSDLLHLNLDSGISFEIGLIKLSSQDSSISSSDLTVKPGIFDYKWYRTDNKMEVRNSIEGFKPKILCQKNDEIFSILLNNIFSNYEALTFEWYKDSNSITGFSIDTYGKSAAKWVEVEYKKDNSYGRKLRFDGLNADGFIIKNTEDLVYLSGKIGGSRLIFSDYINNEWHTLTDTSWDINGDGLGFFNVVCDPTIDIELSSLDLLSNWNLRIDSTFYAPSFFNISWDYGLNPAHAFYKIDTNNEHIGYVEFDLQGLWWQLILSGNTLAAEDFKIGWELGQGITTSGYIVPTSVLGIQAYIDNLLIFNYEYP